MHEPTIMICVDSRYKSSSVRRGSSHIGTFVCARCAKETKRPKNFIGSKDLLCDGERVTIGRYPATAEEVAEYMQAQAQRRKKSGPPSHCRRLEKELDIFYDDPMTQHYGAQECSALIVENHRKRCAVCRRIRREGGA